MSDPVNTALVRELLKIIHREIRDQFPEIENVVAAAGVTCSIRHCWFVEIDTPGRPRFCHDCRADSATEARFKGWNAFLNKYGPKSVSVASASENESVGDAPAQQRDHRAVPSQRNVPAVP